MEAQMEAIEQLTAISLLIVFLFGITCGVIGGAVHGSRRGILFAPASDDLLSAGARVFCGVYTRADDGYRQPLLTDSGQASEAQRGGDGAESCGREANR
jgi:hypothetical protein